VDFFPPVVDDPYTYGAVAAANAMSDVYAMGGEVVLALNVVAFPEDLPAAVLTEILRGGADKVAEGGGIVAGGHTVYDREPKYGLCVMGVVHPDAVVTRAGARPGDALLLTKPIGTGIVLSAAMEEMAAAEDLQATVDSMLRLNRHPSHLAREAGVHAMTDVTGFALLGHAAEIADASGVGFVLRAGQVPLLPGTLEYAEKGVGTGGGARNRENLSDRVDLDSRIPEEMIQALFDPQTSGGLLIALPEEAASRLDALLNAEGWDCWHVGEVVAGSGIKVLP
jgi:selenide,water dikinase